MRLGDFEVGRGAAMNQPLLSNGTSGGLRAVARPPHRPCYPLQGCFTASFIDTESLLLKPCLQGAFSQSCVNPPALASPVSDEFRD